MSGFFPVDLQAALSIGKVTVYPAENADVFAKEKGDQLPVGCPGSLNKAFGKKS